MGILSRPKLAAQQRFDLEDLNLLLSAMRTDSLHYTKQFVSSENQILKGFAVSGIGLKSATVSMANATLINPESTFDFSWFVSAPSEPNIIVPDADLADGVRNYLELQLSSEDNTELTRAFWDPEANGGLGQEFNQIVDTVTDLKCSVVVSQGGFSGNPDRVPLAIIDTDGSGTIKTILDRRNLMFRLAKPNDLDNDYSWGTKSEPGYSAVLTGVVGTFVAGETLTINTETAKVVTGGTTSLVFNEPSGINFFPGSSVTGGTSGATGTLDSVVESFSGVDKSISNYKDMFEALMSELKAVKGTRFWWEASNNSLQGISSFLNAVIVGLTTGAKYTWSGTALSISDNSGVPAATDNLAKLTIFGNSGILNFRRQDGTASTVSIPVADGQVLFVKLPATGSRNYSGVGSGDTNYQTVANASFVQNDENFWIAYREGAKIYVRGYGELMTGESAEISDPISQQILTFIGATSEADSTPVYTSTNHITQNGSLVAAISEQDAAMSKLFEDRNITLHDGGILTNNVAGTLLSMTQSLKLYVNSKIAGGAPVLVDLGSASRAFTTNGNMLYAVVNRVAGTAVVTADAASLPAAIAANEEVFLIAKRVDSSDGLKQIMMRNGTAISAGASTRLGTADTVFDTEFSIVDFADPTKKIKFDASAATTGFTLSLISLATGNRSLTFPDATDTLVGRATVDTLTNKTIQFLRLAGTTDNTTTGTGQTIPVPTTGVLRLTAAGLTSVAGIVAGVSFQQVTIENKTGNVVNIGNEDALATAANRILTGTNGTVSMQNNATFVFTYDSVSSRWMLTGGSGSGSGSGGVNFIPNGNAETDNPFIDYVYTAGTRPVASTGGPGTSFLTTSITNTTPLDGNASFLITQTNATNQQGQAEDIPFLVPPAYRGKVVTIDFDHILLSGTFQFGTDTQDSDLIVYIIDVDNNVAIEPSNFKFLSNSTTISTRFSASFQTSTNSNNYRLSFYKATSAANLFSMKIDNISVSPSKYVYGTPITDWQSVSVSGTWLTNTTYSGRRRRMGDTWEYEFQASLTGAPTAVQLGFNFPTDQSVDITKLTYSSTGNTPVGDCYIYDAPAGNPYEGKALLLSNAVQPIVYPYYDNGSSLTGTTASAPVAFGNGDFVKIVFRVPIVGASSSVQMSDQTDTKVIASKVYRAAAQSFPNGATTQVLLDSVTTDKSGMFDLVNNRILIRVSGTYEIYGQVTFAVNATNDRQANIYINGAQRSATSIRASSTIATTITTSTTEDLIAGDYIDLRGLQNSGGSLALNVNAVETFLTVKRVSGPSAIAASETIAMSYSSTSGPAIGTSATAIAFTTKDFDSRGSSYVGSTYTAPATGKYRVSVRILTTAVTLAGTQRVDLIVNKNGAQYSAEQIYGNGAANVSYTVQLSDTIHLNQGETLQVLAASSVATSVSVAAGFSRLCIERIGI